MRQLTHINLARGFRGGERQTELLVGELAKRGIPQRVVVRQDQPLQQRLAGVDGVHVIPIGKPFAAHLHVLRGGFVHAHEGHAAHIAHWAHVVFKAPYVITRRVDNRPSDAWGTRLMYRQAAGVAVLSDAIGRVMNDYLPDLKWVRIPSALNGQVANPTVVAQLRKQWQGKFVVGQVGALDDSHKGQTYLIQAARQLLQQDNDWLFVLVGGGKDEVMLREAASDIREQVVFTGHVDNVADHLAAFDMMAYPSVHEGLGSTLLDAMQAGLPIVASRVDGIPEIIENGQNGLLTPPQNGPQLAVALRRLRTDTNLAEKLSSAAKHKTSDFTPEIMADRYLAWYQKLGYQAQ